MRLIKLLYVCFAPMILLAQNAFIREYTRPDFGNYSSANIYNIAEWDSKFHVFGGASYHTQDYTQQPFSLIHSKIEYNGSLLSTRLDSTFFENAYFRSAAIMNNNLFAVGKKWNDNIYHLDEKKFIQKIDKSGNVSWSKTFGDSSNGFLDNYIHKIYRQENNLVVLSTGNDGMSYTLDYSQLDEQGTVLIKKQHKTSLLYNYLDKPIASEQTTDGLLVIVEGSNGPANAKYMHTLLKLDKQGNELWRKLLNNYPLPERENVDSVQKALAVFKMKNDYFGVVFQLFRMDSLNQYLETSKTVLAEFDAKGNFVRSKGILEKVYFDIQKAESNINGDIYLFGNTSEAHVSKVDQNFNLIWFINFGTSTHNIYQDGCVTADGGMIHTGTHFRYTEPKGYNYYVVKTDCMGNIEWDSESCIVPRKDEIAIMGNPMKDQLLIQFPQIGEDVHLEFKLFNSIGQIVVERQITGPIISQQVSQLSTGIYFYMVKASNGANYNGKLMKE